MPHGQRAKYQPNDKQLDFMHQAIYDIRIFKIQNKIEFYNSTPCQDQHTHRIPHECL